MAKAKFTAAGVERARKAGIHVATIEMRPDGSNMGHRRIRPNPLPLMLRMSCGGKYEDWKVRRSPAPLHATKDAQGWSGLFLQRANMGAEEGLPDRRAIPFLRAI